MARPFDPCCIDVSKRGGVLVMSLGVAGARVDGRQVVLTIPPETRLSWSQVQTFAHGLLELARVIDPETEEVEAEHG